MKKWNDIKQKEILSKRVSADNSTTEKLGIERKELQEMSKNKNLQTIADNRQYRKKKKFTVMFLNPLFHLLKKLQKVLRLFVDLKNIQPILLSHTI